MKWPRWSIRSKDPVDFLPATIGCVFLFVSVPAFLGVLIYPDRNAGLFGTALLILLGLGVALGAGFLIFGVRICAYPGSLAYRITHPRLFLR
jgi:hypothetical protein